MSKEKIHKVIINPENPYCIHIENADWSKIIQLRQNGVPWDNLRTRNGLSALGMAIFEGSSLATQTLIEIGAPVHSEYLRDSHFFSPLWSAIEKEKTEIVDILLQSGCNPNEKHPKHGLPLFYTSENHLEKETILLCRNGASPNTNTTPTPLWFWINYIKPYLNKDKNEWIFPNSQVIIEILKSGAQINTHKTKIGMNELEFAKRLWLKNPLKGKSKHHVTMTLAMMEKNLYGNLLSQLEKVNKNKKQKKDVPNKF